MKGEGWREAEEGEQSLTLQISKPQVGTVGECDGRVGWNGGGISIAAADPRQALERLGVRNAVLVNSGVDEGRWRSEPEEIRAR